MISTRAHKDSRRICASHRQASRQVLLVCVCIFRACADALGDAAPHRIALMSRIGGQHQRLGIAEHQAFVKDRNGINEARIMTKQQKCVT